VVLTSRSNCEKIVEMKPSKAMTIRLSADQAEALETVATVEQLAVAEVIRAAISEHVENRRRDPGFQAELRERIGRAERFLVHDSR
jgi:predicted transcriptional regulator